MASESKTETDHAGDLLERSSDLAALAAGLAGVRATGQGRLVLLSGEAGIGKSALVRAFCASEAGVRAYWGACEALSTPRPLGPLLDLAARLGGELEAQAGEGAAPAALVSALAAELGPRDPAILVLEDLHWADEATLDFIRVLARRIQALPALVVATLRDDQLDRTHPLRVVLGELPRGPGLERIALRPLSVDAVAALGPSPAAAPEELHRRTAGNPFFVTEVLAAGGVAIPDTVRDAVLARAARLDEPARRLLDAVAVVPPVAELWLLETLAGEDVARLEACLASGMLGATGAGVAFRHEIARVAVEEAMPLDRRVGLHRHALRALTEMRVPRADPARLVHHAEAAGDGAAVLRHAPEAGERAAGLRAHREAAAQFARALRYAGDLPADRRASLLERRSYECYLTDQMAEAIDARRLALEEHRKRGDRLREGDAHRWLARLVWFEGDNRSAEAEAARAVELLESLPPGRELAMAWSTTAQLRMLADDPEGAVMWGRRAIDLAERLGDEDILAHALNNVGTAQLRHGDPAGAPVLERSLSLALEAGFEEHVARAYTNLASIAVHAHDYACGDRWLEEGVAYSREHDLDSWALYMRGWQARSWLEQGRWDAAGDLATAVLHYPAVAPASRIGPLAVLGCLRARRGDPGALEPLDEALELARGTGELQRLAPVAAARAERAWLAGDDAGAEAETEAALALALEVGNGWDTGRLLAWRRRAGVDDAAPGFALPEPYRLELGADMSAAAACWDALGCPYEAALARAAGDGEAEQRDSVEELQRLGARPAANRVARGLRERGVRDIRHGPRTATRENLAGLTPRELELLELVAEGMRNAEIAARLFLSEKTVQHHVSSILRKLGARTRAQAGAEAARLGLIRR